MKHKITLIGQCLSTNHIYKYRLIKTFIASYMSADGKALKEDYQWQIKSQYKGTPVTGDIEMEIHLFHGDKRKRDIDNFNKLILDACSGIIFINDSQIIKLTITKTYCKENPRAEIYFF